MATVVRLQDGEGWTPRNVHQSEMMLGTICYRLLASEQLALSAIQRACLEYAGKEALKGLLGWQVSAKPPLIASGPPPCHRRMASKQVRDGADRDTVSKLHRSCVEDSNASGSPLGERSESRPP